MGWLRARQREIHIDRLNELLPDFRMLVYCIDIKKKRAFHGMSMEIP